MLLVNVVAVAGVLSGYEVLGFHEGRGCFVASSVTRRPELGPVSGCWMSVLASNVGREAYEVRQRTLMYSFWGLLQVLRTMHHLYLSQLWTLSIVYLKHDVLETGLSPSSGGTYSPDRRQRLTLCTGADWVCSTWRRRQKPDSETLS
jgi:hypothetical protein